MGGGGGDDGYEQRQQETERRKQQARDALNAQFGVGSSDPAAVAASIGPAPQRSQFTVSRGGQHVGNDVSDGVHWTPFEEVSFDQAGYDAALAGHNAKIADRTKAIGGNAQARDTLYQGVRDNAFTAGKRRLDEDAEDARRKLKFELFATGLAGGSEDIDQNKKRERIYDRGIMDLGAKADAAKAQFRADDEDTRLQLLQSIDAGMDQGSALSQAAQRMQIASDRAAADAQGTALGDLFDSAGLIYDQSQMARGRQAGQQAAWEMFPRAGATPRASNKTGVTTRLPGE